MTLGNIAAVTLLVLEWALLWGVTVFWESRPLNSLNAFGTSKRLCCVLLFCHRLCSKAAHAGYRRQMRHNTWRPYRKGSTEYVVPASRAEVLPEVPACSAPSMADRVNRAVR